MALLESFFFFCIFLVLGIGVTAIVPSMSAPLRIRLSPGIGMGLYLIFALPLSRAGLPVRDFVYPLSAVLVGACGTIAILRPPMLNWRELTSIVAPLAVAAALVGSPMLTYDFHWLSYSNDDMTNYSLSAQRLSEGGYFALPRFDQIDANRNLQDTYWGLLVRSGERAGVDLLLASTSSALHQNPFEGFMPLIFSAFLAIVVSSGALGVRYGGQLIPMLISLAVAGSSLAGLGVFYQLLGQEFGLAAICTIAGIVFASELNPKNVGDALRLTVVTVVASCALAAVYPELIAVVFLAAIAYFGLRVRRRETRLSLAVACSAIVLTFAVLNSYAVAMFALVLQRVPTRKGVGADLFPYYLLPSGFPNLWGLQRIAHLYSEPLLSIVIVVGMLLTLGAVWAAVVLWLRSETPAAPVFLAFTVVALASASRQEAFALYKLAMYVQPFLIAVVVSAIAIIVEKRNWPSWKFRSAAMSIPVLVFIAISQPAMAGYRDASADTFVGPSDGFTELPSASRDAILVQVKALSNKLHGAVIISDTFSAPLAKIEAGYFHDDSLLFYVTPTFFDRLIGVKSALVGTHGIYVPPDAPNLASQEKTGVRTEAFDYTPNSNRHTYATFETDPRIGVAKRRRDAYLLAMTDRQTVLNRLAKLPRDADLALLPLRSTVDHLSFVDTDRGIAVGTVGVTRRDDITVSLYQLERDPIFPLSTMADMGRYSLFAVDGATGPIRLILELTASFNGPQNERVPPVQAVGTRRVSFHAAGAGSARLISDPVMPVIIDGTSYVGIDMGTPGQLFPDHREGLMKLYGDDILLDPRSAIAFVRDLSAVPAKDALSALPSAIERFPEDLEKPNVFYSGLYENGWAGREFGAYLDSSGTSSVLRAQVMVPLVTDPRYSTKLTISVDGSPIRSWKVPLGRSTLKVQIKRPPGVHEVRLQFAGDQQFPAPDLRRIAARIEYLGFH